jgi:urate oxidase / 2-oxo-4-hydroxy-4-carboxy-5-ureidoimidazoline decarboxylase
MEHFASGRKQHYYGKGDVIVYRLRRDGATAEGVSPMFGASVLMLVYGDAFWPTYATGDNTGLIATDSMKNFIQHETLAFGGQGLEDYCRFLGEKFLGLYSQVEGVQVTAVEIPYKGLDTHSALVPSGPEQALARIELNRAGTVEVRSGIRGFRLLRLGGSAFSGFVRDEYTTLPEIRDRPLHMWLDLEWHYTSTAAAFTNGRIVALARRIVTDVFQSFESGSIQQMIYQMGTKLLADLPEVAEVHLEANNRTWDTVTEQGDALGIFTDARPPYGCLGLRLSR